MGKFQGVLLATDFDDTLFRSNLTGAEEGTDGNKANEPVIFGRNKEALDYYLAQGGRFTVATGRAKQTFAPYVDRIPMNAPAVLANGAVIHDFQSGEELSHAYLPPAVVDHAKALALAMPQLGFETHLGELIYTYRPNEITWRHIRKLACPFVECGFDEMPLPWTKLLAQHEDHDLLAQAVDWLQGSYPGEYEAIFSNHLLLEVTRKGATKGGAILDVAHRLGVERENLYCVGDNQNDIPMLKVSAIPFAPSNCAPEVRESGARIVCACEDGAVADVIEALDARYK